MKFEGNCRLLGISLRSGYNYEKAGMPRFPVEAMREWLRQNKPKHKLPDQAAHNEPFNSSPTLTVKKLVLHSKGADKYRPAATAASPLALRRDLSAHREAGTAGSEQEAGKQPAASEPIDELAALEESYQACIANLKAEAKKDVPDFDLIIKGTQALARVGVEKRKEREAQERIESIRRQTDKAKEILVAAQTRAKSMIQTLPRRLSALLAHKDEAEIEQILTADLEHFMKALQDGARA